MSPEPEQQFNHEHWQSVYNRACWSMRACTELPNPEIIYDKNDPSPFSIAHKDWKPHLNVAAVPDYLPETGTSGQFGKEDFFQDCSEHEIGHYKIAPFDLRTHASLLDAATKQLKGKVPDEQMQPYAATLANMFTDIIVDTMRRDGYGRSPNPERVEWTEREMAKEINRMLKTGEIPGKNSSESMRIFRKIYEELWETDLGVEEIEKLSSSEKQAAKKLADTFKGDYHNRDKWYKQMSEFSKVMAPVLVNDARDYQEQLKQDARDGKQRKGKGRSLPMNMPGMPAGAGMQQPGQGGKQQGSGKGKTKSDQGGGKGEQEGGEGDQPQGCTCKGKNKGEKESPIPMDIQAAVGTPNPIDANEEGNLATVAETAYGLNEKDKDGYENTMLAAGVEPGEARRFWYRIKAKKLLDVKETEEGRGRPRRSYYSRWRPGDPVETLDVYKTLAMSPKIIPGKTTVKARYRTVPHGTKKYRMKPDLLIIRDSSGSMEGEKYEAAKIGGFAALDFAADYGIKVAFVDHNSGVTRGDDGNPLEVGWTTNYRRIEDAMLGKEDADGGTILPVDLLQKRVRENKNNPIRVIWLSDAELNGCEANVIGPEVERFIDQASHWPNGFTLLHITPRSYQNAPIEKILKQGGEVKQITRVEDIAGTIVGTVKGIYEEKDDKK